MTQKNFQRTLSPEQIEAAQLIAGGLSVTETALTVGVARQTVSEWKNQDSDFKNEVERQRSFHWRESISQIKTLTGKAIEVLNEGLQSNNFRVRLTCARAILSLSGIENAAKESEKPPVVPQEVITKYCSHCEQENIDAILKEFGLSG
jgi:hypothetical protein